MPHAVRLDRRRLVAGTAATLALGACGDKSAPSANAGAAAAPAAKPSPQQSYELAAQGHGFTVGSMMAANTVYVFFDTACPHCASLWMNARPLLTKLKMVWMPVSLLRATSTQQGATILAAPDPAAAMTENETSVLERKGGIAVNPKLGDDVIARVNANTELFRKLGADSVPLVVYRNAKNGLYGSTTGTMSTEELATLVGV